MSTPTTPTTNNAPRLALDPEFENQVVTVDGFTVGQLREAFEYIRNSDNWKRPIDAWVPVKSFNLYNEAAIFFAGSPLSVKEVRYGNLLHVHGDGYYICIGA